MRKFQAIAMLAAAVPFGGCSQSPVTTTPATTGPMDPASVSVFTLALQPDSISGCVMGDPSMTRPVTLTVRNNRAELVTSGGVHDVLTRVRPNVYSGNFQIGPGVMLIQADLSASPKRLTVTTSQGGCKWAATAA